ncbi:MAG: GTPase Era [Clostridia bacterium]
MPDTTFKSGFFTIIGSPNVGKSTLINRLVSQKIAIVTERAQTTRNKITGILTKKDCQLIFIDTPGVIAPKNRLGEYMQNTAYNALNEVEGIAFVVDALVGVKERDETLFLRIKKAKAPIIPIINKIDRSTLKDVCDLEDFFGEELNPIRISARDGTNVGKLIERFESLAVPGPMYFPEDMVTDQPERTICAEFIREAALTMIRDEIPHGIGVYIDKIEKRDDKDITDVFATIYCERESHKGIIIGKNGAMMKRIGIDSRHEIEWLLDSHVNLKLYVKVKPDWRNSGLTLRELGYE